MENDLLTRLCAWLQTAPDFAERVLRFGIDDAAARPGSAGLYPQGVQEQSRTENLLGEVRARCRCTFTLRLVLGAAQGNAEFLLGLQQWVCAESAAHRAPTFGNCETQREVLSAAAARLTGRSDAGTASYTMTLKADYTMIWRN